VGGYKPAAMSLVAMPWIFCNLASEMLYVLEQRLRAQAIAAPKAARVLQDLIAVMFDRKFLEEKLFIPQDTYTLSSTKKVLAWGACQVCSRHTRWLLCTASN
jgi:hypothetical protein